MAKHQGKCLTVRDILDILGKRKTADYRLITENVLDTLNIDPDKTLFKDYLEQIENDPLIWFESFPNQWKSTEALAKPKTVLFNLLEKSDAVRNEIGIERCIELIRKISKVWLDNKITLHTSRTAIATTHDAPSSSSAPSETDGQDIPPPIATPKPKISKETKALAEKVASLEQEKKDMIEALQDAKDLHEAHDALLAEKDTIQTNYNTLIDAHNTLKQQFQQLQEQMAQSNQNITNLTAKMADLKDILIEVIKDKGGSQLEIKLVTRLLPQW